jgi:hypothetical protein
MRTIVDIPDDQIKALDRIGNREKLSRAELVRRAVSQYLEAETPKKPRPITNDIFGIAKPGDKRFFDGLDGVEYQRRIRAEWDDRDKMYGDWNGLHDHPQEPLKPDDSE